MSSTPQLCSQWQLCTIILNLPCTYSTTTIIPSPVPYQLDLMVKALDLTVFCMVTWLSRRPMSSISSNNSVTCHIQDVMSCPLFSSLLCIATRLRVANCGTANFCVSGHCVQVGQETHSHACPCVTHCKLNIIVYNHWLQLAHSTFNSSNHLQVPQHVALLIPQEKPVKWGGYTVYMC